MEALTEPMRAVIRKLFPASEWEEATALLERDCGRNLPLLGRPVPTNTNLDRIRFGVLKLSGGNLTALRRHVSYAQRDWRDILVAAGFANSLEEHKRWAEEIQK
jgi:hypothetical protein